MILADWIAIGLIALFCLIGFISGFGRGLRFFTGGIFGIIISIIVCYCLGGFIYKLSFVQDLLQAIGNEIVALIIYYVVLFVVVTIARVITVLIIKRVVEIDNIVFKLINRLFGMLFFAAMLVLLTLTVFQIIYAVSGGPASSFRELIDGSALKLDGLYDNNPLISILKAFIIKI